MPWKPIPALRRLSGNNAVLVLVGVASALCWLASYRLATGREFGADPGWSGWFDQGKYLLSARAFAAGDLSADQHWYPLLYPLLAAPFVRVFPNDPFLVPDLVLFSLCCCGFASAMRALRLRVFTSAAIFLLSTLALKATAAIWLQPWTTTLSATLMWWMVACIVRVASLDLGKRIPSRPTSRRRYFILGLLAGSLPLARPSDAIVSVFALGATAVILRAGRQLGARAALAIAAGGAAAIIPYCLLHLSIYGAHLTPYFEAGRAQGFAFADLPWKAYVVLITPRPWYPDCTSLIEGLPLLVPGAAGLIVSSVRGVRDVRIAMLLIAGLGIPYCGVFLAYTDLHPSGLWRFNNVHYFKWILPFFGAGLFFWVTSFGSLKRAAIAVGALALVMLPACFRILPAAVPDGQPARMLQFDGTVRRQWNEAYFASSTIRDSAGSLVNVGQFHQLPDRDGVRAISTIRAFAAHPRLSDPGESPPFRGWRAPQARYGERLSFGKPCWFDPATCNPAQY